MESNRGHRARSTTGQSPSALSASEAAKAAGLHRSSILRGIEKGRFPNAFRERGTGPWRIPVEDLRVAGLSPSEDGEGPSSDPAEQVNEVQELRNLLDQMTGVAERALATLAVRDEQLTELRRTLQRLQQRSRGAIPHGVRGALVERRVPPWSLDWFFRQAARTFISFLPILVIVTVSLAIDTAYNIQLPIAALLFVGYLSLGSWARLADQLRRRR
jgi:hypothetical protein